MLSALKDRVFHKVRQAMIAFPLITAAGIDGESAPCDLIGRCDMYQA